MGCYMSTPDNRVYVSEGEGKNFKFATASCQGWRREQEDAEACLPYYDDNSTLFILCDGHGGAEVAKYTVEHLPDFIKNHPLYKAGKYSEALEKAFIDFDSLLRSDKVMDELSKLAFDEEHQKGDEIDLSVQTQSATSPDHENSNEDGPAAGSSGSSSSAGPSGSRVGPSTVVEDVDTDTLKKEAQLPLRQLIEQYSATSGIDPAKRNSLLSKYNSSPVVRAKKDDGEDNNDDDDDGDDNAEPITNGEDQPGPSSSGGSLTPESIKESLIRQVIQHYFKDDDSSDDSEFNGDDSSNDDGDDEGDDEGLDSSSKKLRKKKHKRPLDDNESSSEDVDDESDEDDESDDDEESEEDEENDDEEEEDDEDEEIDENKIRPEEEDDDDEDENVYIKDLQNIMRPGDRPHKPGYDSGCTVVVALLKDGKLYVASAGDSRCIMIMRRGECKPMSFDHKPEAGIERRRILKAGGRVTDGRVNGGLNLSRALGDFTYKNSALDPKDQMITPCPDVRVAELDPKKVEYVFLACDGIWNSMRNQQATRFIRKTAPNVKQNLVDICVQLFRKCIAPRTDGDGTGCDNMTCIIARFNGDDDDDVNNKPQEDATKCDLKTEQVQPEIKREQTTNSQKRSTINEESDEMPNKRRCIRL